MDKWNDIELFAAVREGEKEAMSILFLRHYDYLKHYGLQILPVPSLVEECIQEMFIYIFESYARLGEVKQVKAYLFRALRRRVLEKAKKERKLNDIREDLFELTDIQFSQEDIRLPGEEQGYISNTLAEVLNALPWRQREAIYLRYYNGLSTTEIAEIMGVANQTILNTLYQALKKVRKNKQLRKIVRFSTSLLLFIIHL